MMQTAVCSTILLAALGGRPTPVDPAARLADRVVAEMARDGYTLIRARYYNPTDNGVARRMTL